MPRAHAARTVGGTQAQQVGRARCCSRQGHDAREANHHLAFAPWATGSNSGSRVTTELIVRGRRFLCSCFRSTRGGDLIEASTVSVERCPVSSEVLPTLYGDIHI